MNLNRAMNITCYCTKHQSTNIFKFLIKDSVLFIKVNIYNICILSINLNNNVYVRALETGRKRNVATLFGLQIIYIHTVVTCLYIHVSQDLETFPIYA